MTITVTTEMRLEIGSGGCWGELEITCNYIPGERGDRWNPPSPADVEILGYRFRRAVCRREGKWVFTDWQVPDGMLADLIDNGIDRDWLVGEADDQMLCTYEAAE